MDKPSEAPGKARHEMAAHYMVHVVVLILRHSEISAWWYSSSGIPMRVHYAGSGCVEAPELVRFTAYSVEGGRLQVKVRFGLSRGYFIRAS